MSHQPFSPVVGSGCKDRKVWPCQTQGIECNNGSLSLRHFHFLHCPFLSFVLFLFRKTIWSVTTSGRLPPLSSAIFMPRRILPMAKEGFFLELGPWPNVGIDVGLLVCYTPQLHIQRSLHLYYLYFVFLSFSQIQGFIFISIL